MKQTEEGQGHPKTPNLRPSCGDRNSPKRVPTNPATEGQGEYGHSSLKRGCDARKVKGIVITWVRHSVT